MELSDGWGLGLGLGYKSGAANVVRVHFVCCGHRDQRRVEIRRYLTDTLNHTKVRRDKRALPDMQRLIIVNASSTPAHQARHTISSVFSCLAVA